MPPTTRHQRLMDVPEESLCGTRHGHSPSRFGIWHWNGPDIIINAERAAAQRSRHRGGAGRTS